MMVKYNPINFYKALFSVTACIIIIIHALNEKLVI